jgi:hypothetical protein
MSGSSESSEVDRPPRRPEKSFAMSDFAKRRRSLQAAFKRWFFRIMHPIRVRRFKQLRPFAREIRKRILIVTELPKYDFRIDPALITATRSCEYEIASSAYRRFRFFLIARVLFSYIPGAVLFWVGLDVIHNSSYFLSEFFFISDNLEFLLIGLAVGSALGAAINRARDRLRLQTTLDLTLGIGLVITLFGAAYAFGVFADAEWTGMMGGYIGAFLAEVAIVAFGIVLMALLSNIVYYAIYYIWLKWQYRARPEAMLVGHICHVLSVGQSAENWRSLAGRGELLSELELAARCLEYFIPRKLPALDPTSGAWQENRTRLMAAALRTVKIWILNPQSDTREHFIRRIAATLQPIALGDWHSVEQLSDEDLIKPVQLSARQRAGRITAALVRAALPLVLALLATKLPLGSDGKPLLEGGIANYLVGGTIIYAILTLLMAIDPQISDRVAIFKEVVNMIPERGKGGPQAP